MYLKRPNRFRPRYVGGTMLSGDQKSGSSSLTAIHHTSGTCDKEHSIAGNNTCS